MELDTTKTAVIFVVIYLVMVGGTAMSPMQTSTVAMVAAMLAVYGLVSMYIGVKHGEYRG